MARVKKQKKDDKFGDFPKKWAKWLEDEDEFISKAQQSDSESLNAMIIEFNENVSTLEKDYDADEDIKSLKEQVKYALEPFVTGTKKNMAKIKYCIALKKTIGTKSNG